MGQNRPQNLVHEKGTNTHMTQKHTDIATTRLNRPSGPIRWKNHLGHLQATEKKIAPWPKISLGKFRKKIISLFYVSWIKLYFYVSGGYIWKKNMENKKRTQAVTVTVLLITRVFVQKAPATQGLVIVWLHRLQIIQGWFNHGRIRSICPTNVFQVWLMQP